MTIACDNESSLKSSFDIERYSTIDTSFFNFDVLQSIRRCMIPTITCNWHHVKGHQDTKDQGPLDFWEELHLFVYLKAKESQLLLELGSRKSIKLLGPTSPSRNMATGNSRPQGG